MTNNDMQDKATAEKEQLQLAAPTEITKKPKATAAAAKEQKPLKEARAKTAYNVGALACSKCTIRTLVLIAHALSHGCLITRPPH